MASFVHDPHYFVEPDLFWQDDKALNVRGYLVSFLSIPLHIAGYILEPLTHIDNFAPEVIEDNFSYELTITMLYTVLSAVGLLYLYRALYAVTNSIILTFVISTTTALGTYIWKYSAYYARSGYIVLFLGILTYLYVSLSRKKNTYHSFYAGTINGLLFGIDPILFIAITATTILMISLSHARKLKFVRIWKLPKLHINVPIYIAAAGFIIGLISMGNVYFYNSLSPSHVDKWAPIYDALGEETADFMMSAPLLPVSRSVLFNAGKLPQSVFTHIDQSLEMQERLLVSFIKKYNFYGMFIISPFLLASFLIFLFPTTFRKHFYALTFSFLVFGLAIAGNSKIFGFWGGNQYDIRYFYPFAMLLALPTALAVREMYRMKKEKYFKHLVWIFFGLFFVSILISLLMGWLGEINMFQPALRGERKIWLILHNIYDDLNKYSPEEYLNATFMNRFNVWAAWVIGSLTILLRRLVLEFFSYQHARMSFKRRKGRKHK